MSDQPRPASAFSRRIQRTTSSLAKRRMLLGWIVVAVGLFMAYISWVSVSGPPFEKRYEVTVEVPPETPILRPGDQVRIAGRLAGFIKAVEPSDDATGMDVRVNLRPEFIPIGSDARANVRVRSIVYLTYLEIFPGNTDDAVASGHVIEEELVTSGVDLLEVVQLFDEQGRETLRKSVINAGYGLAGRGRETNEALVDLAPAVRNSSTQIAAARRREGAIAELVGGSARTTSGLRGVAADDLRSGVEGGAAVLGAVANRRSELGAAIDRLRPFEDEFLATAPIAEPLLRDVEGLSVDLLPAVVAAREGLSDLNRLLGLGTELRSETVAISELLDPVLEAQRPLLRATYPTATAINPLLEDFRTISGVVTPYDGDISAAGRGLASATSLFYPSGATNPDNPALRFTPILGCHQPRNPFPDPGGAREDSQAC